MATSFRFLYRMARSACLCRCHSMFTCQRRSSTSTETGRKQKSIDKRSLKPLFTKRPVNSDRDEMRCGDPAPEVDHDVTDIDADRDSELPGGGGVAATNSCLAAVGVTMAGVATPNDARRQSAIVRLTKLRQQIGVGLHSADGVRVPVWLSVLLVVVYIAVGAVLFTAGESVGVTSELFLRCSVMPVE